MKYYKDEPTYPLLRRNFKNFKELGAVINRSASYINRRMMGAGTFSDNEKSLILKYLGEEYNADNISAYFPEGGKL